MRASVAVRGMPVSQPLRVHQPTSSPDLVLLGFYGGFIPQARSTINCIFTPSGMWGRKFQAPVMVPSFRRPALMQEPT